MLKISIKRICRANSFVENDWGNCNNVTLENFQEQLVAKMSTTKEIKKSIKNETVNDKSK